MYFSFIGGFLKIYPIIDFGHIHFFFCFFSAMTSSGCFVFLGGGVVHYGQNSFSPAARCIHIWLKQSFTPPAASPSGTWWGLPGCPLMSSSSAGSAGRTSAGGGPEGAERTKSLPSFQSQQTLLTGPWACSEEYLRINGGRYAHPHSEQRLCVFHPLDIWLRLNKADKTLVFICQQKALFKEWNH